MMKLNFKDAVEIWKSWPFLCALLFFFSVLWFFPSEWITDTDLAALYSKYRPKFGLLAIVFGIAVGIKVIIEIFKRIGLWSRSIRQKHEQKIRIQNYQDSLYRRMHYELSSEERELLNTCIEKGDPKFIVNKGDGRIEKLRSSFGILYGPKAYE